MAKKTKLIHILCHIPNSGILNLKDPQDYFLSHEMGSFHTLSKPPWWIGFFAQDHHALAAKELLNLTDEFEVECWRPYGLGIKQQRTETVKGIKHRVFPARKILIPHVCTITWSASLFKALKYEINTNQVIVNISVGHAWFHIILMLKLKRLKRDFGMIALHRSGGLRHFMFYKLDWWKRLFKWFYFFESWLDLKSLIFCDQYFISALPELNYLKENHPNIKAEFLMEGIDFAKYAVLSPLDKKAKRSELGLPVDKSLFIIYGNWIEKDYGYGKLIQLYKGIKASGLAPNLQMVMIGGYKSQDLYPKAIESDIIMIERCAKSEFIKYLEVSDFFGQPSFYFSFIQFGGFGTAMIEALACGLPVISNNIIHFPGNPKELAQLGLDMKTPYDLKKAILYMNDHSQDYKNTREIARKYYDLNQTRMVLLNKYRELEKKYFHTT